MRYQIHIEAHPVSGFTAVWGDYDLDNVIGQGKTKLDAISDLVENTLSSSSPNDELSVGLVK